MPSPSSPACDTVPRHAISAQHADYSDALKSLRIALPPCHTFAGRRDR
jgi:hypothetical protein